MNISSRGRESTRGKYHDCTCWKSPHWGTELWVSGSKNRLDLIRLDMSEQTYIVKQHCACVYSSFWIRDCPEISSLYPTFRIRYWLQLTQSRIEALRIMQKGMSSLHDWVLVKLSIGSIGKHASRISYTWKRTLREQHREWTTSSRARSVALL